MAKNKTDNRKRAERDARTEMAFAGGGQGDINLERRNPLQVYNRESNLMEERNPMPEDIGKIQEALNQLDPDTRYELMRGSYEAAIQWLKDNHKI